MALPWHRRQFEALLARRDRLPHALLIRGPEGTALDLELSVYRDPLCFMHWNDIYLLYVRKGGKRVQTLERVNYEGMQ